MTEDNSHAGQGAVLLDIGGDVGALVVKAPASMEGIEVEIRPVGADEDTAAEDNRARGHHNKHDHTGDHSHDLDHEHDHDHGHAHGPARGPAHDNASPWPHVAVVARPAPIGIIHSLVYPHLQQGSYELYVRPHGAVQLTVDVTGGYVTEAEWPA